MVDKVVVLLAAKGFKFPQTSQKPANFKYASSRQFEQRKKNYKLFFSFLNHGNFFYTKKNTGFFLICREYSLGFSLQLKNKLTQQIVTFLGKKLCTTTF